jgi:hypothetical protein
MDLAVLEVLLLVGEVVPKGVVPDQHKQALWPGGQPAGELGDPALRAERES